MGVEQALNRVRRSRHGDGVKNAVLIPFSGARLTRQDRSRIAEDLVGGRLHARRTHCPCRVQGAKLCRIRIDTVCNRGDLGAQDALLEHVHRQRKILSRELNVNVELIVQRDG